MKLPNRFLFSIIFFQIIFANPVAANQRVLTIGESVGIVAEDELWECESRVHNDSGLCGESYGLRFIHGASRTDPVIFDFFRTIEDNVSRRSNGVWGDPSRHLWLILENYTNCTNTGLMDWKVLKCEGSEIILEGRYLNEDSCGFFRMSSVSRSRGNFKRSWFTIFTQIELQEMEEERRYFHYTQTENLRKNILSLPRDT